mgnify:CR=1 FL=1
MREESALRRIQVVGAGCPKCGMLEDRLEEALRLLRVRWRIERVIDPEQMARFDPPGVPALFIDGELVLAGRVPEAEDLAALLR